MDRSNPAPVTHWEGGLTSTRNMELLGEEPLSIRVEGKPYAVVMRTPGEEAAHAAGFCLGRASSTLPRTAARSACARGKPQTPSP